LKTHSLCRVVIIASSALLLPTAHAAKKPAKPAGKAVEHHDGSPAEQLAPFIEHIDALLALERPATPAGARLNQAPGKLAVLKQQFVEKRAKAGQEEQGELNAAIATCDVFSAALDERQKAVGQMQASAAVKNSGDLGRRRKDNLSQGQEGHGVDKAVGTIAEARRERQENREAQHKAAIDDNALTAAAANRWNQRAIELRREITASYGRISHSAAPK